jgi:Mce-associated membrane protein
MSVTTDEEPDTEEAPAEDAEESAGTQESVEDPVEDDDTAVADAESDTDAASDDRRDHKPRWGRRILIAALALFVIGLIATTGFLGWQLWQAHQLAQASKDAQQAAVTYAQDLTGVDSDNVDEDFAKVLDGATGEFKDMYTQSSMELRDALVQHKVIARGVVIESAVQSASKNKVVVLLFVDQTVSNTEVPDPRVDQGRYKMTMEYVDGRWRASKIELP